MARYRRRTNIIEAELFTPEKFPQAKLVKVNGKRAYRLVRDGHPYFIEEGVRTYIITLSARKDAYCPVWGAKSFDEHFEGAD